MSTKGSGVILLDNEKFSIYTSLNSGIFEFKFVPEIFHDMEIINKELFENILNLFLTTNGIEPLSLTVVIADSACFIKDFYKTASDTTPSQTNSTDLGEEHEKQILEFLDRVPFEDVASCRQEFQTGTRVFAANLELIDFLKFTLEKQANSIEYFIPASVFPGSINSLSALTPQAASLILQSAPQLKKYNFWQQRQKPQDKKKEIEEKEQKKTHEIEIPDSPKPKNDNKRLILLGSVFAALILVLVIVYYVSNPATDTTLNTNASQPVSSVEPINAPHK